MLAFSESALADADILLYVTDVVENPEKNLDFLEKVREMKIPVLLLINKIDETDQQHLGDIVEKWHALLPNAEILPISAQNKFGIDMLMKRIEELLPESPAYFDKDLSRKLSARRSCVITTRKFLILLRSWWSASRRMSIISISML